MYPICMNEELELLDEKANRLVINWFPGHMRRTGKLIVQNISRVDMVIEMRDARIPISSENPFLQEMTASKPTLILLNKADLADDGITKEWISYLKRDNRAVLAVSANDPKVQGKIINACKRLLPDFNKTGRTRIRAMITGIPNVGKSTLLNSIATRTKAKTGNRPGVTTDLQQVRIAGAVDLIDTPGVLWPKIATEAQGIRLSSVGSVKDAVVDMYRIAVALGEILMESYPEELKARYKLADLPENGTKWLEIVGRKRGCLQAGGVIDVERAGNLFITEFREGRIGKISLDLVKDHIDSVADEKSTDENADVDIGEEVSQRVVK